MTLFVASRPVRLSLTGAMGINATTTYGTGTVATTGFTLSGATSGYTNSAVTYTVTPYPVGSALASTVVVSYYEDPTPTSTPILRGTLTFTSGTTAAQAFTITRTTDGTSSVSIASSLAEIGSPISLTTTAAPSAADFATRASASGVVWSHAFERDEEVSSFQSTRDWYAQGAPLVRELHQGKWSLRQRILGGEIAQTFIAGGSSIVFESSDPWPDPAVIGTYRCLTQKAYPALNGYNVFDVTSIAYDTPSAGLTTIGVTRRTDYDGQPIDPSAQNYSIGDYIAQESYNWVRPFSAMPAGENGKLVNDRADSGAVPVRSRLAANAYSVPHSGGIWHYGYYGHATYRSLWANWTPWIEATTYTTRGPVNGADAKYAIWDGGEFWLSLTVWIDGEFENKMPTLPTTTTYPGNSTWARKFWGIETEQSQLCQLVTGISGNNIFTLPSTLNKVPFALQSNKANQVVGVSDWNTGVPARTNPSPQYGSGWHVSPWYANTSNSSLPDTGLSTPDGAGAWEVPYGEWVTFKLHVIPGRSRTPESTVDVFFARAGDASYNGQWTKVLGVTDATINYDSGESDQATDAYPADGVMSYPTTNRMTQLLGYQAFYLFGYINFWIGYPLIFRDTSDVHIAEMIFSRQDIAPPLSETAPTWVPPAGEMRSYTAGAGVLTNNWRDVQASNYGGFYQGKLLEFSGGIANPYWGQYGAVMGFGGGHASTNDNSVWLLDLGATSITFKRLTTPPAYYGTGTDDTTRQNNNIGSTSVDATYGEAIVNSVHQVGTPGSAHSGSSMVILPPAFGGAAHGTFLTTARLHINYGGYKRMMCAHAVDLPTATGANGSYSWRRYTDNTGPDMAAWAQSMHAAFVAKQARVYWTWTEAQSPPQWFDLTTNTYGTSGGTAINTGGAETFGYTHRLVYVEQRDLLIYAVRSSAGYLRLHYAQVSATDTDPSWVSSVALSANLPIALSGTFLCWCPDNERLLLGNISGDPNCVYEIEIPDPLGGTWQCTRVGFTPPSGFAWPTGTPVVAAGWEYNHRIKAIVVLPDMGKGTNPPSDKVYVYKPRGT